MVRLSQRDIDGLMPSGRHWGAPSDLLAAALRVPQDRLYAITVRWRRAGYAATGLGYPAGRPALGRLAHIRAILAARLWMQASAAWPSAGRLDDIFGPGDGR